MKESRVPLSVRIFKTRKYLSDKKSSLKDNVMKIKENRKLKKISRLTKSVVSTMIKNMRENKENWMDRANADEGFIIDS